MALPVVTDNFGGITLPIATPGVDEPIADKFLFYALQYFQAFVNAKGSVAWNAVQPGKRPIENTFAHDPEQVVFNEKFLPALFMWREESGAPGAPYAVSTAVEWIAEDYLVSNDTVRVLWVFPNAEQHVRRIREPIVNGLIKALSVSFEFGRDPAWVVPGDTDPQAATLGSVFARWASVLFLTMSRWQRRALQIRMTDNTQRVYETVEARLSLQEVYNQDVSRYGALGPGSLDLQLFDSTNTLLVDEIIE